MAALLPSADDEKKEAKVSPFDFNSLLGVPVGYVPLPTNVVGESEGSLWSANFRNSTSIGAFISSTNADDLNQEEYKQLSAQDIINKIPEDLVLGYADRYIGKNPAQFDLITDQIRSELNDRDLIAQHPWKSFAIGLAEQPFDPVNWLPLGALYKNVKRGSQIGRAIVGSGAAAAIGAAAQESIIQRNQLTREMSESAVNVAVSGIIGAALGGIGTGLTIRGNMKSAAQIKARENAYNEVKDVLTDKDKELDANGLLKAQDLVDIPAPIRKLMNITPMNRLLNSNFDTAKFFANAMYEHNYTLLKHLDENTDGASVETLTRLDQGKTNSMMVDYQNMYFDMIGIPRGPFKGTRAKLANVDMTMDQFNEAVWRRLSNQEDHPREAVNRAALMLEEKLFNPTRDRAIELGLLSELDAPRNAPGYILSLYNKNKIIEQGGKSARGPGTFPQFLYEKFQEIQSLIKQYKATPDYQRDAEMLTQAKINLKKAQARLELSPAEQERVTRASFGKGTHRVSRNKALRNLKNLIRTYKEDIKNIEIRIKENAPRKGLDSDGKLFPVVDDETLWTHVEQTIDHILGDTEGQMLNPLLEKLKRGSSKPLKSRKMTVTQEDMFEWHVTDIPKLVQLYSRAMHPMIRLTEFAQAMGANDLAGLEEKLSKMMMSEFDAKAKGVTGKAATTLRKQRDANLSDMRATIMLIQGIYGDGPNVLNDSARNFYQGFLKWNSIRLLGYMTISSFADAGLQVFVHGPYRFIHDGLVNSFSEARNISKQDLRAIGYGIETELGTRLKSYTEHQGLSTNPGPFTRGLDSLTQSFGNLSLMNQWNSWQQSMAGHIGINRTLQVIHKFMKGEKVAKVEMERVIRSGLDKKHWKTIFEFTKNNDSDGTLFADWSNWNIQSKAQREALTQFQAAVAKEIDSIVIIPGYGDKPLFGQTPTGKLLFQFKSFLMAATNRVAVSGIQRKHDVNVYLGVLSMLAMGALSYVAASLAHGRDPDLSFKNLSTEAVDKSGILGIWGEFGNIAAKPLGFTGTSRYASRDTVGALIGPSSGALSEVISVLRNVSDSMRGETTMTTKDAEKLLRLAPMQNLFYIHYLNRKAARGLAVNLGAIEND